VDKEGGGQTFSASSINCT